MQNARPGIVQKRNVQMSKNTKNTKKSPVVASKGTKNPPVGKEETTRNGHASPKFNAFARKRENVVIQGTTYALCAKDRVALYVARNPNASNEDVLRDVKGLHVASSTLTSWIGTWKRGYNFPRVAFQILSAEKKTHAFKDAKDVNGLNVHIKNDGQDHATYVASLKKEKKGTKIVAKKD